MAELVCEEGELEDGACDEVGQHGGEAGEIDEVLHGCSVSAIDVDDVAEGLEGVEADAEWEGEMDGGNPVGREVERVAELGEGCEAEVAVFEEGEGGEVADDGEGDCLFLAARSGTLLGQGLGWLVRFPRGPSIFCDDEAEEPVERRGGEHEEDERGFGPSVKSVPCEGEPQVPLPGRLVSKEEVAEKGEREEAVDKNVGTEDHPRGGNRPAANARSVFGQMEVEMRGCMGLCGHLVRLRVQRNRRKIENMMRVCVVSRLVFLLLVTLGFGGGLMALPLTTEFGARFEAAERGQFGAVAGEDPWFFLPSELRFLSVESFRGDTIRRLSRARDKQWADPVPAIVDFHEQLKRMGVKLLVVPVPAKAAIYPDRLFTGASKMVPGLPKALGELYGDLRQAGVDVLDFTEEFIANRDSEHGPVYCATDSHWSGLGCVLAAKVIAQQVGGLVGKGSSKGFAEKWEEAVVKGDLLDLPGKPATRVPHEKLWVRRITTTGGGAVKGESSSPILLLGDSHTLVFGELLCEGAGLVEQLGYELGVVPDLIGLRGAGATDVRGRLLRRGMKEDGYLRGKKVVIWCFGAREFSEADSGWVKLPVVK